MAKVIGIEAHLEKGMFITLRYDDGTEKRVDANSAPFNDSISFDSGKIKERSQDFLDKFYIKKDGKYTSEQKSNAYKASEALLYNEEKKKRQEQSMVDMCKKIKDAIKAVEQYKPWS